MIAYDISNIIDNLYIQIRQQNTVQDPTSKWYFPVNSFVKNPDVAMHVVVEVTADNHGYEIDGNTHHPEWERHFYKELHVLITANHNVFLAKSDNRVGYLKELEALEWVNTSNHDSCYRTDGLQSPLVELMFEAWEHAFNHMPEEHMQDKSRSANIRMVLDDRNGNVLSFYRIKHEPRDRVNSYHRKLTSIKPLQTVIDFKEIEE